MTRLKIAIQKSGRLNEDSLKLLKECGISIDNGKDQLKALASNFDMEVLYLRNADIPQYVKDGVADIAIIGDNTEREEKSGVVEVLPLGFSKCRLAIAIPKQEEFTGLEWLQGKRIATSYPNSLQDFLNENNIKADIHVISGSVEIAPNIGLADAICDLVSSGNTLFKNGLKEVYKIFSSQAVLVKNPNLCEQKQQLLDKIIFRMRAVLAAKKTRYILLNAPVDAVETICNLLPGVNSPTIMPLQREGWVSIHSVVNDDHFWEVIDQLKAARAEGILVIPIEKIIN
ncbi:MAG: ATP phosphoribosyltransferase [Marinifilaceae bacterium]